MKTMLIIIIFGHLGTSPETVSITEFNSHWACDRAKRSIERVLEQQSVPTDSRHRLFISCIR